MLYGGSKSRMLNAILTRKRCGWRPFEVKGLTQTDMLYYE